MIEVKSIITLNCDIPMSEDTKHFSHSEQEYSGRFPRDALRAARRAGWQFDNGQQTRCPLHAHRSKRYLKYTQESIDKSQA